MKFAVRSIVVASLALSALGAFAQKGETVKIAWIDPLSGLMAPVGNNQLKSFQFFAEKYSKINPAGVKFEVVGFDNKLSPAESLNVLKAATDQGIRYITQGNGSGVAGALIEAVNSASFPEPVIRAKKSGLKIDKAIKELNYKPLSFEEGIRKSFNIC